MEATHVTEGKSPGERYTVALLDPSEASVDAAAFCFSNSVVSALSGPTSLIATVRVGEVINSWHCVVLYISLVPRPAITAFFTVLGGKNVFFHHCNKKSCKERPGYGADCKERPGYGADCKERPGYGADCKERPGYGADCKEGPGYGADCKEGPGYGADCKERPGYGADCKERPGYGADCKERPGYEADCKERPGYEADCT